MKECTFPGCHYPSADWEEIRDHYVSEHGALKTGAEANTKQVNLGGRALSRDDRIEQILLALPQERVQCVYCFMQQDSKAARQFNGEGKLLKIAKCVNCKKTMELATMRMMRDPRAFGHFVGSYKGWWFKVEHDAWLDNLKIIYSKERMNQFWAGYAEGNPGFAERQRIREAGGGPVLAQARAKAQEDRETQDEMAKYKKPDGSIDWKKMAEDAKAAIQGRLQQ
jgi:hypothetical protein